MLSRSLLLLALFANLSAFAYPRVPRAFRNEDRRRCQKTLAANENFSTIELVSTRDSEDFLVALNFSVDLKVNDQLVYAPATLFGRRIVYARETMQPLEVVAVVQAPERNSTYFITSGMSRHPHMASWKIFELVRDKNGAETNLRVISTNIRPENPRSSAWARSIPTLRQIVHRLIAAPLTDVFPNEEFYQAELQ